jgi:hypothetical protein
MFLRQVKGFSKIEKFCCVNPQRTIHLFKEKSLESGFRVTSRLAKSSRLAEFPFESSICNSDLKWKELPSLEDYRCVPEESFWKYFPKRELPTCLRELWETTDTLV